VGYKYDSFATECEGKVVFHAFLKEKAFTTENDDFNSVECDISLIICS
jgi:hypothetical protein